MFSVRIIDNQLLLVFSISSKIFDLKSNLGGSIENKTSDDIVKGPDGLYVLTMDGKLIVYTQTGQLLRTITLSISGYDSCYVIDSDASGHMFIGDNENEFEASAEFIACVKLPCCPTALVVHNDGQIYVCSIDDNIIFSYWILMYVCTLNQAIV